MPYPLRRCSACIGLYFKKEAVTISGVKNQVRAIWDGKALS